jgi:hypothetical protein
MRISAIMLGIVVAAAGCDKAPDAAPAGTDAVTVRELADDAQILFQVSGERDAPRLIPIATVAGNSIATIELDSAGWARFDARYFAPGTTYPVLRGGRVTGRVTVTRGMWSEGSANYTLPGCRLALPAATVALEDPGAGAFAVELFATTPGIVAIADSAVLPPEGDVRTLAYQMGALVGKDVELDDESLALLEFRGSALDTRATGRPSIVASFLDPSGGDEGRGRGQTAMVLAIADDTGNGYAPTYRFAHNGDAVGAEFRRVVDALDLTGDGVAELLLESWRYAGPVTPVVLTWRQNTWREVFRGRSDWCLQR